MLNRRQVLAGAGSTAFLIGPASAGSLPVRDTVSGRVRGMASGGVEVFRGIPYARSPGGQGRFRPPQPALPWAGTRDCLQSGPACPQIPAAPTPLFDWYTHVAQLDEDCLTLNVFCPPEWRSSNRPVMVWLHGGGWIQGSGNAPGFDATELARVGEVVVVTVNHRLGVLGHVLLDESDERFADAPNLGVLDMIAALRWVRKNILNFGGDPGNVTLFGQSGGAAKVSALMAAPAAKGYFHRAIAQSCSGSLRLTERAEAEALASDLAKRLGLIRLTGENIAGIPTAALLKAATETGGVFRPLRDDRTFSTHPFDTAPPESAASVPLLIGNAADEARLTMAGDPTNFALDAPVVRDRVARFLRIDSYAATKLVEAYASHEPTSSPSDILAAIATDWMYIRNTRHEAELQSIQSTVFAYLFRWRTPVLNGNLRSPHGIEVPFVFGTMAAAGGYLGSGGHLRELSLQMIATWSAFARGGAPSTPGNLQWPAFKTGQRSVMCIDGSEDWHVERDPGAARRTALEHLPRYEYSMPINYARP